MTNADKLTSGCLTGLFVWALTTAVGGWALMLLASVVHAEAPAVPAIGYWMAATLISLTRLIVNTVTLKVPVTTGGAK